MSKSKVAAISICVAVAVLIHSAPIQAQPALTLTALPQVPGSLATIGTAINSSGAVAGYAYSATTGQQQAFLYAQGTSSALPNLGGGRSAALAINDQGTVVGWSETSTLGVNQAFSYSLSAGTIALGTLGGNQSVAQAINESGAIVGYSSISLPFNNPYGSFVHQAGTMSQIDLGLDGIQDSFAYSINSNGSITGTLYSSIYQNGVAFTHINGVTTPLGTLGGSFSAAFRINNDGRVAGNSQTTSGATHAFLFNGSMTDLGTLSGPRNLGFGLGTMPYSGANDLNASGYVVGSFGFSGYQGRGFLFADGQMYDLNDLVDAPTAAIWEITDGMAINASGTIVAYGYRRGENIGTTLLLSVTPVPEIPTSYLLLSGLSALLLAARRRKRGLTARSS